MKRHFLKIILFFVLMFTGFSQAQQTTAEYISFYNVLTPKLNSIVPYKTNFYHQNFSEFYNELTAKHIDIVTIGVHERDGVARNELNRLVLYFCDGVTYRWALDNNYQIPIVWITFEELFPPTEIKDLAVLHHLYWHQDFLDFFANRKIEKIEFVDINGYNSSDTTIK